MLEEILLSTKILILKYVLGIIAHSGANGVGKTTLLSNIVNFIDPLEGSITYNNLVIDNHIASNLFYILAKTNFAHDSLTLNQNIEYWLSIHNVKFNNSIKDKSVNYFFQELNLIKNFISFHLVKRKNFNCYYLC